MKHTIYLVHAIPIVVGWDPSCPNKLCRHHWSVTQSAITDCEVSPGYDESMG